MSGWRRVLAGLAVAALLALLALALLLPRLAASDAVRERLAEVVEDAAGLPFRYESLEAGLLPPRLELHGAELGYDGAVPAAEAGRVELRIALLPLLRRTVLVDALVVEQASAHVVRQDGELRLRGATAPEEEPRSEPREPPAPREEGAGFSFAIRSASVAETRLTLERDDGSRLEAGPISVRYSLGRDASAPSGPFVLDLGDAAISVRSGGAEEPAFEKPAGVPARLAGDLTVSPAGAAEVSDLSLDLGELRASGQVAAGERTQVVLDAEPFSLASVRSLFPAASEKIGGNVALSALAFTTEPSTLGGALELAPLVIERTEGTLELEGRLSAEGDRFVGERLLARIGEFEAPVALRATELFDEPRVALDAVVEDAESATLVAALSGDADFLTGPLDLEAHLTATAAAALETLSGDVAFEIAPGRMRGVSLLQRAVESAGLLGGAALDAASEEGARLGRFYEDEFESLGGTVRVRGGVAHTDDLRLVYRHYAVALRGDVALEGLALDMSGTLTIDEELDAALRGEEDGGRRRVVPLARVGGTVESPRVRLSPEAIRMIAGVYATDERREKWERKLDEYLGEGSGRSLLDALLSGSGSEGEGDAETESAAE